LIGDDGHALLTDFGLSKVIEELTGPTGYTTSKRGEAPIRWQAPELVCREYEEDGEDDDDRNPCLSPSSDVWSFACTAYEVRILKL